MPRYSKASLAALGECDPRLQKVFLELIKHFDVKILEGHRTVAEQQKLYAQGRSTSGEIVTQIDGVNRKGKHNYLPSKAVDIAPWPINWTDTERFVYAAGFIKGIAASMGIQLRWGGDWDQDTEVRDERFRDIGHFEVVD